MTTPTFRLGDKLNVVHAHHESIAALWELKWKEPCKRGLYPFHDGCYEDFEEVFNELIKNDISDPTSAAYTTAFTTVGTRILARADEGLELHTKLHPHCPPADDAPAPPNRATLSALYLRAASLFRLARFPHHCSTLPPTHPTPPGKATAWSRQKTAYLRGAALLPDPITEVLIPHTHRTPHEGSLIPVYIRVPAARAAHGPVPAVLLFTGLDGYRPDNTARTAELLARGWATVVLEIPGTGDSPGTRGDPAAGERLARSVLGWMRGDGRFDGAHVGGWGLSCGGYEAVRVAHTLAGEFRGVVAQGAGCHYWFSAEWLCGVDGREYPFRILPALAVRFGFESVEEFVRGALGRFSLREGGVLNLPATRLLAVNGMEDGLMPLEDSCLLTQHGTPKDVRFFPGLSHMGYPLANDVVYPWLESVLAD